MKRSKAIKGISGILLVVVLGGMVAWFVADRSEEVAIMQGEMRLVYKMPHGQMFMAPCPTQKMQCHYPYRVQDGGGAAHIKACGLTADSGRLTQEQKQCLGVIVIINHLRTVDLLNWFPEDFNPWTQNQ